MKSTINNFLGGSIQTSHLVRYFYKIVNGLIEITKEQIFNLKLWTFLRISFFSNF